MVTVCTHFVCNGCIPKLGPMPDDTLSNSPPDQAGDKVCCACGTAVPNGGPVGSGAFYTERNPTYGWPFCSCR